MGAVTGIEWTNSSWNPWHGCHKVSQGCKNCYMFRDKKRYGQDPDVVVRSKTKFNEPLKWPKRSTLCFTCSWSDWLIEEADAWREEAYDVIRQTPWITYQILTKRIERAPGRVPSPALPNVWLGVSVEDQKTADVRIPLLLRSPAAVRFVSYEPALGPVDFTKLGGSPDAWLNCLDGKWRVIFQTETQAATVRLDIDPCPSLDWLIVGGESGPEARPPHPEWLRAARDQCIAVDIPFFFKQWGEWVSVSEVAGAGRHHRFPDGATVRRVGKANAGALLDGQEWRQFPEVLQR